MADGKGMNVSEVLDKLRAASAGQWHDGPPDRLLAGDMNAAVTGVAVVWAPSIHALKQAKAEGCNLLLVKDPLFWSETQTLPPSDPAHSLDRDEAAVVYPEGVAGITKPGVAESTDLGKLKKNLIDTSQLNVVRVSHNWNGPQSNALLGLLQALNWKEGDTFVADDLFPTWKTSVVKVPQQKLVDLAKYTKSHLDARSVRLLGDRNASVTTVAVHPGYLSTKAATRIGMERNLDVILTGESCEWEGFVYCEDWISGGHGKGLIMTGLAVSSDPGAREFARWAQGALGPLKVTSIADGDPFTPIYAGAIRA